MVQDSIFNLTELFSVMFRNMADCLLRSSFITILYFNGGFLLPLSLLYLSIQFCFHSGKFLFPWEALSWQGAWQGGLVSHCISSERLDDHINFKFMLCRPFAIVCDWINHLFHPPQFYLYF